MAWSRRGQTAGERERKPEVVMSDCRPRLGVFSFSFDEDTQMVVERNQLRDERDDRRDETRLDRDSSSLSMSAPRACLPPRLPPLEPYD